MVIVLHDKEGKNENMVDLIMNSMIETNEKAKDIKERIDFYEKEISCMEKKLKELYDSLKNEEIKNMEDINRKYSGKYFKYKGGDPDKAVILKVNSFINDTNMWGVDSTRYAIKPEGKQMMYYVQCDHVEWMLQARTLDQAIEQFNWNYAEISKEEFMAYMEMAKNFGYYG